MSSFIVSNVWRLSRRSNAGLSSVRRYGSKDSSRLGVGVLAQTLKCWATFKRLLHLPVPPASLHVRVDEIDARRLRVSLKAVRPYRRAIASRAALTRRCPDLPLECGR